MDENKSRLNDQDLSIEELEAIFSGPSLADSIDSEADREELARLAQSVLNQTESKGEPLLKSSFNSGKELSNAINPEASHATVPEKNLPKEMGLSNIKDKHLGTALSAQLNLMASGASDVAARRTSEKQYEVSTFAAAPEKKIEVQAISTVQEQDNESAEPEPNSPEALRERIKAYQERTREKNLMAQSLGVVFSFGFTVAAVILAFWWLGQRAVEYSGRAWLAYPCIIFGVLLGLYSGALVLKPFLKGALPVVSLAKDKVQNTSQAMTTAENGGSKAPSVDEGEGQK